MVTEFSDQTIVIFFNLVLKRTAFYLVKFLYVEVNKFSIVRRTSFCFSISNEGLALFVFGNLFIFSKFIII